MSGHKWTDEDMFEMARKYANHRVSCGCFICRTFLDEDRDRFARWLGLERKP